MRALLTSAAMALALSAAGTAAAAESSKQGTLYKNPQCGCCEGYANYLRGHGYDITVKPTHDLPMMQRMAGVPETLEGCHSMMIDGYVVEGHVPAKTLNRLLSERPDIKGISLPGMPLGSPGMSGRKAAPFTIYEIGGGEAGAKVYAVE